MTIIYFRCGSAEFQIDLEQLPELPLTNIRKLFRFLLAPTEHNDDAVQKVAVWLPEAIAKAKLEWGMVTTEYTNNWRNIDQFVRELSYALSPAERRKAVTHQRQINRMLISSLKYAKSDYERLIKIQTIFNETKEK